MALNVQQLQGLASGLPDEIQKQLGAVLRAQDKMNRDIAQILTALTPGPWIRPEYQNGWLDFSPTVAPIRFIRYRLELGGTIARLEGVMSSGTINTTAFILPAAFCPSQTLAFATTSNLAFAQVDVNTSGAVVPRNGVNASFHLNISWGVG